MDFGSFLLVKVIFVKMVSRSVEEERWFITLELNGVKTLFLGN